MAHSIGSKPLLLKNFKLHEILNYSAKFSSATRNRSVAANVSIGLKLFDDKLVSKISFTEPDCLENDYFFIQGFVKAEMKKKVTYKSSVQIRTTCQVISATCTSAGGTPAFSLAGGTAIAHDVRRHYNANNVHISSPPTEDVNFTLFACLLQGVAFCKSSSIDGTPLWFPFMLLPSSYVPALYNSYLNQAYLVFFIVLLQLLQQIL
ncbi:hypothetical protein TNCV_2075951 [Trichonephila clavipes]|nr:hypothetical protein TNCV_2075951 [Trichonephila clavipes]